MTGFLSGIESLGSNFLMIFIAIIGIIIVFKVAKEILGLVIKIAIIALIIYLLYRYTNLYYYLQGIFSSFDIF